MTKGHQCYRSERNGEITMKLIFKVRYYSYICQVTALKQYISFPKNNLLSIRMQNNSVVYIKTT